MWRRRRSSFAKGIGLGAFLGVAAILIHGFTDFNLQIPANAVYFTTLAMLGAAVLATGRGPERGPGGTGHERGHGPQGRVPGSEGKGAFEKGDAYRGDMSPVKALGGAVLAVAIFVPAVRDFMGFHHLGAYRQARREARSVESAFPVLETRLALAAAASPRSVFRIEQARLYVEMARVANAAGRDEDRDAFCDQAIAAYNKAIAANPIDAAPPFEAASTYLFYNYPLMTYQDRAKDYFRRALALKPADETINLTVAFLYFAWWQTLEDAEKEYAGDVYRRMAARDATFPAKLEARWKQSFPTLDGLNAVLAELAR
jgi:tetratricopeptide (TPR) repeat protein